MLRKLQLTFLAVLILEGCSIATASAQPSWEFLGPDVGYEPDAFFATEEALYLGISEEDETGLGLYRYRFDEKKWELFAWEGFRITGITVWGESDSNILVVRHDPPSSAVLRSTDGGVTWVPSDDGLYLNTFLQGIRQAPADTARVMLVKNLRYSSDGGWSWNEPGGNWPSGSGALDVAFDPGKPLVGYSAGISAVEAYGIYKTLDGGANWSQLTFTTSDEGVGVEEGEPDHIMSGGFDEVGVTTDGGDNWSHSGAPFRTKRVVSPHWWPRSFFLAGTDLDQSHYEVWWTSDLGESWTAYSNGLPDLPGTFFSTKLILQDHPAESILYGAFTGAGVWRLGLDISGTATPRVDEWSTTFEILLYPNPSSASVNISLRRGEALMIGSLRVLDVAGRLVATLDRGNLVDGTALRWDGRDRFGRDVTSGVYQIAWIERDGRARGSEGIVVLR